MTASAGEPAAIAGADIDRVGWLEGRLRRLLGTGLASDAGTCAIYSSDGSNYRVVPRLVAMPTSLNHLAEIVGLAAEAGVGTGSC